MNGMTTSTEAGNVALEPLWSDERIEDLAADAMRGGRTTIGKLVTIRTGMEQIRNTYEAERTTLHAELAAVKEELADLRRNVKYMHDDREAHDFVMALIDGDPEGDDWEDDDDNFDDEPIDETEAA